MSEITKVRVTFQFEDRQIVEYLAICDMNILKEFRITPIDSCILNILEKAKSLLNWTNWLNEIGLYDVIYQTTKDNFHDYSNKLNGYNSTPYWGIPSSYRPIFQVEMVPEFIKKWAQNFVIDNFIKVETYREPELIRLY